jgi:hypothetical protein
VGEDPEAAAQWETLERIRITESVLAERI